MVSVERVQSGSNDVFLYGAPWGLNERIKELGSASPNQIFWAGQNASWLFASTGFNSDIVIQKQFTGAIVPSNSIRLGWEGSYAQLTVGGVTIMNIIGGNTTYVGTVLVPKLNLINTNVTSSVDGDLWYYEDVPGEGSGIFFNSGGNVKQLDFDSNTVGPIQKVVLNDNGNGTINVPALPVFLYSTASWIGTYRHYHIPEALNLSLTDNAINYLVANYNSGSPVYQITTNSAIINNSNIALIATMSRYGTEIHWIPVDWGLATAVKLNNRQVNIQRFQRSSGLMLSETPTRIINISSGVIWYGHTSYAESAVVSSSNNADFWYHSGGNWTKSIVSEYNNTQYDDGTDLQILGNNNYTVNWVYRYIDGAGLPKIAYVLSNGNYNNIANAKSATAPIISTILDRTAILVGRIIVQKNATVATQIDSAFIQTFAGSTVTNHDSLSGLQGGITGEYYHLTNQQHTGLITKTLTFVIDGGGSVPATGAYASIRIPFSGTITGWSIVADVSGSVVLDIWKLNGVKPTNVDSITALDKPTLTTSDIATSSTLTGWTTAVLAGDVMTVELESVTTSTRLTLQLDIEL